MPRSPAQSGEPSPFESQLRRAIPSLQVIIENPKLSSSARLLYALIAARTNHFGYAEIHSGDVADRLGLRRTTVSALMKELRDANAIETRQQGGGRPLLVKLKEPDSRDFRY